MATKEDATAIIRWLARSGCTPPIGLDVDVAGETWAGLLPADWGRPQLREAATAWLAGPKAGKWPTVRELQQEREALLHGRPLTAREGWDAAMRAVARWGSMWLAERGSNANERPALAMAERDTERIYATVRDVGGWRRLGELELGSPGEGTLRAHWERVWDAADTRSRDAQTRASPEFQRAIAALADRMGGLLEDKEGT